MEPPGAPGHALLSRLCRADSCVPGAEASLLRLLLPFKTSAAIYYRDCCHNRTTVTDMQCCVAGQLLAGVLLKACQFPGSREMGRESP